MKITAVIAIGLMTGLAACAEAVEGQRVTVCMEGAGEVTLAARALGQKVASTIYGGVGVRLEWRSRLRGCPPDAIQISLSIDTPALLKPGALAYAMPYEGTHIRVFYDRIERQYEELNASSVLGHVLAHEIGHVLEGTSRHSDSGVMRAHWSRAEVVDMRRKPLSFEALDIELIHAGLAHRARTKGAGEIVFARAAAIKARQ